jgi:hypothetical protein
MKSKWIELLTSRKFWVTVIVLIVLLIGLFQPTFHMDADAAAGLVVVAVAYLIGVAVDPGMSGWRGVLQSRKFWAAVLGFLIMILDGFGLVLPFDMTLDQLVLVAVTIGGYIAGVALEQKAAG